MGLIKRRQYVVDKKLQIGTAFSVIAASFLVVAVVIAIIAFGATRNNRNLADVIQTQDEIVQAVVSYAEASKEALDKKDVGEKPKKEVKKDKKADKPAKTTKVDKAEKDDIVPPSVSSAPEIGISEIVSQHRKNITSMNMMVKYNSWLLWIVTALVLVQGLVLFAILIVKTHHIAGPIYVMSMYMRQILSGRFPVSFRSLRDGDLLKEFYDLFVETITFVKVGKKSAKNTAKKKR